MTRLQGFPPVALDTAHTLILGSMPGAASLSASEYYAHPRNAFWRLIGELLGFDANLPYEQRLARLTSAGYALWDVLGACRRNGSLDTAIQAESLEVNPIADFLAEHPLIDRVFFNGSTAENLFRRHVMPTLRNRELTCRRLPSTSPAHASLTLAQKTHAWREILR
ncbi:MAG TPA: DNA-deoxyinosine glycosylase [Azoarcus taiwanensis]|nr:DNA-deoxyinosine glycosylase [Azoarcus taiwanensis]